MGKGRVALSSALERSLTEQQVPPLRYAPVGMTIHIWVRDASAQENYHPDKKSQTPGVADSLQFPSTSISPSADCNAKLDKVASGRDGYVLVIHRSKHLLSRKQRCCKGNSLAHRGF
jgi:hypothetical protein